MASFFTDRIYSVEEIASRLDLALQPELTLPISRSEYFEIGDHLIALITISSDNANQNTNSLNGDAGQLTWMGKPHSHSAQSIFKNLLEGRTKCLPFIRWEVASGEFQFFGAVKIVDRTDNCINSHGVSTIKLTLEKVPPDEPGPDGELSRQASIKGKTKVLVNRYERDPRLRNACLLHFGPTCQICGFDFESVYGEIGSGFCHVHHIEPLSETGSEQGIDPVRDLIPVCPNCHSMLHRTPDVLRPDQLKEIIRTLQKCDD